MRILLDVAGFLFSLLVALVLWGRVEPYLIGTKRQEVEIAALPDAWQGRNVALIADLQVGMWWGSTSTIERIVRRIVREEADLALIAGDFVYHAAGRPELARRAAGLLEPLVDAGIPTYAVLGNHDYDMPTKDDPRNDEVAAAVRTALEEIGIRVLENESVALAPPTPTNAGDEPLYLVGIGAHVPGYDRPDVALAEVPDVAAHLVLMHHPNSFEEIPAGGAPLAVAGHTHGGQLRVPLRPGRTWSTCTTTDKVHADGFSNDHGAEENRFYVDRGFGFSGLPLGLNHVPELTPCTLRRPDGGEG